jgi:hypothetical protein
VIVTPPERTLTPAADPRVYAPRVPSSRATVAEPPAPLDSFTLQPTASSRITEA